MPRPFTGGAAASTSPSLACGSGSEAVGEAAGAGSADCVGAAAGFLEPGRRAPAAMPRPLTGGSATVDFGSAAVDVGSEAVDTGSVALEGVGVVAFLAPGRFAPAAMPRPLTGSALAGSAAAAASGAGAAAAGAAFFAPGRFAPPAMPRPFTGAAAAGFSAAGAAAGFGSSFGSAGAASAGAGFASTAASFAAVPFSGSVTEPLSSEPNNSWATSSTSAFGTSLAAATSSTP